MVELRWAVSAGTTTKAPRLQYRQLPAVVSLGGTGWSEWQDVPYVVVQEAPTQPVGWCNKCGARPTTHEHKRPDGSDCHYIATGLGPLKV